MSTAIVLDKSGKRLNSIFCTCKKNKLLKGKKPNTGGKQRCLKTVPSFPSFTKEVVKLRQTLRSLMSMSAGILYGY